MFARLQLALATASEALTVPREAVIRRGGDFAVFVIESDGTAKQRRVKLGIEDGGRVQIVAGVKKGEAVAVAGHNRLSDGKNVRVAGGPEAGSDNGGPGAARGKGKGR